MIFLVGKRTARLSHFTDTKHICFRCRAFDREVNVFQPYFHFCFIPFFPIGAKSIGMKCRSCGDDTRLDAVIDDYQIKKSTPVYFFSGPALCVLIAIAWYFWHSNVQKETAEFLAHPAIGDVYTIEENSNEGTKYNFMRVAGLQRDTVFMLENHLEYTGFVSDLADDDYFRSTDTLAIPKSKLLTMREDKLLSRVQRNFSKTSGFNRIK